MISNSLRSEFEINPHRKMSVDLFKEYISLTKCVRDVQIDHYDEFVSRSIKRIVSNQKCVKIENKLTVKFNDVWIEKPTITPNQARLNNDTYEGVIRCNILCNDSIKYTVPLGKMPIMIKSSLCALSQTNIPSSNSGECENDDGGYFIIKGKERVLVAQMRSAYNRPFVRAAKLTEKLFTHMVEFRSVKLSRESVLVQAKINESDEIFFSLPYIKSFLPAGSVYKALGLTKDELITSLDLNVDIDHASKRVVDSIVNQYDSVTDGLEHIVRTVNQKDVTVDYVKTILEKEICYHVNFPTSTNVADFLSLLVRRLKLVKSGEIIPDDKYNLANKRMDSCCALLEEAFYTLLKQYVRIFVNCTKNRANYDPLTICSSINVITNGLLSRFTTGKWSNSNVSATGASNNCAFTRLGVSQVVSRQNYHAFKSHMRRFSIPISTKGKNVFPRHIHASHFSYICPYETPEGETVGIVGNLCMTAKLSRYVPTNDFRNLIVGTICDASRVSDNRNGATIIVNGEIFGKTSDSIRAFKYLDKLRSDGTIDREVSLIYLREPYYEIHVESDAGRFLRPLLRVDRSNRKPREPSDWNSGISSDDIVFRSPWELEQTVVAMNRIDCIGRDCVYCEINPAISMMGVIAGVIPFSNHSQSPRIAYQSNMGKQAIGIPSLAFAGRYDTTLTILDYPQKPLTKCSSVSCLKFDEMCNGCVPIIAIATFSGYNQEDSVVLNSSSVDRGLFHAHTYKTITDEERKRGNCDFETVCAPKYELRKREYNYSYIDESTGLIRCKPQLKLKIGDVIIGKTLTKILKKSASNTNKNQRELITTDVSVVVKDGEEGYLDSIVDTVNSEGSRLIKVRIRIPRIPEIGDKFASSTAQKGTCGMLVPQENMPFANTPHGVIVPDMVISVHAIHSRMTINQLLEMSSNLMGCEGDGKFFDATPVVGDSTRLVELLTDIDDGTDSLLARKMYSGFTGEAIRGKMFLAPSFYQRLKHMVQNKIHSRNGGPLDSLNHQPVAGRSRDGGLKCGEMEKDALFSHGITSVLSETMFTKSDKYETYVCGKCGDISITSDTCRCRPSSSYRYDETDANDDKCIRKMQMPYATKLLFQYMNGMGIKTVIS